ncbi:protein phosphatase 1 regulatory subunit 14C-like [Manis pentadactyla]|uniref:protein phosphatase 1 regulatory subunit 14C-like n=1 Tax=Manis pentadactyla TaxID=143292 RepID=UPI00255CE489|nr:protein phosphatase 1 regulatory subunit 14C-like [Manis pentadactyla]
MPRRGLRAPAHSARMAWPGPPPRATLFPRRPRNGAGPSPGSGSGSRSAPLRTAAAAAPVTDQSRREEMEIKASEMRWHTLSALRCVSRTQTQVL